MKFQVGKQGLTKGVIDSLNLALKTHTEIRISVLKSVYRDKEKVKELAQEIVSQVDYKCVAKVIGFTIILKRQKSKPQNKAL